MQANVHFTRRLSWRLFHIGGTLDEKDEKPDDIVYMTDEAIAEMTPEVRRMLLNIIPDGARLIDDISMNEKRDVIVAAAKYALPYTEGEGRLAEIPLVVFALTKFIASGKMKFLSLELLRMLETYELWNTDVDEILYGTGNEAMKNVIEFKRKG